ncbi:MAG: IclR family transcriptional regulator [Paracoccaceae bacterium]|nr:MAG: IclR family transcriptional regulator [Paracoccaceae bacterium]
MSNGLERGLAVLDLLSRHPDGLSVGAVAAALDLPGSATHRLLNDLIRLGHVQQRQAGGDYALTIRLAAIGLSWLGRAGVTDLAQPVLDRLAADCGELVRLSVADPPHLVWVAVAQGATHGLRYDPARDQGAEVSLAYSATGRAWLASLPEDQALSLVARQGLTPPEGAAPGSRIGIADLMAIIGEARARGHADAVDCFLAGMAAIAVPIQSPGTPAIGCLSIAGPAVRLRAAQRDALAAPLREAAARIADAAPASAFFRRAVR